MSAPRPHSLDLDALAPGVREAFVARQAKVAGLPAQTKRQDCVMAKLRHAFHGKRSGQLDPDARQLAFKGLETPVAKAEAVGDAPTVRNADGTTRRPAAQRKLGHLPDHRLPANPMLAFDERGPRIEQVIEPEQRVWPCGCTDMVKPPFRGLPATHAGQPARTVPNGWTSSQPAFRSSAARQRMLTGARGVTVRPNQTCRRCDVGVIQAAVPHWLIEGGLSTEGTLAHVAVSDMPITCRFTASARSTTGAASILTDPPWRVGVAWRPIMAAYHLAPVVDRMLAHLKRSNRRFMPSGPIALQSPAGSQMKPAPRCAMPGRAKPGPAAFGP